MAQDAYEGVDDLPQINLRMTELSAVGSDNAVATEAMVDFVKQASKGKITIEVFWGASLMPPMENAAGIGAGLADMGQAFAHFRPSDFPVSAWMQPVAVKAKGGYPFGMMIATGAATEFFATNADVKAEFAERNLYMLGGSGSNAFDIMCTSPITDLASAKGKRTRTGTTTLAQEAQSIGMVPTPLDLTEAYEAFSRGIIDCGNMTPGLYQSTSMIEISKDKYWTPIQLIGVTVPGLAINLEKWNSLPPVAQRIVQDGANVAAQVGMKQIMVQMKKFGDLIKAGKVKAMQPADDLQAAIDAFEVTLLDNMTKNVPAGVNNPEENKANFLQLFDKWHAIVADELGVKPSPKDVNAIIETWYADYDFDAFGKRLSAEIAKAK